MSVYTPIRALVCCCCFVSRAIPHIRVGLVVMPCVTSVWWGGREVEGDTSCTVGSDSGTVCTVTVDWGEGRAKGLGPK